MCSTHCNSNLWQNCTPQALGEHCSCCCLEADKCQLPCVHLRDGFKTAWQVSELSSKTKFSFVKNQISNLQLMEEIIVISVVTMKLYFFRSQWASRLSFWTCINDEVVKLKWNNSDGKIKGKGETLARERKEQESHQFKMSKLGNQRKSCTAQYNPGPKEPCRKEGKDKPTGRLRVCVSPYLRLMCLQETHESALVPN